jgi:uncharacterized protein (TIGR03067 family)
MRRSLLLLGLLVALAARAQDDPTKEELRKLEGRWAQLSVQGDGKTLENSKDGPSVIITGENWIEQSAGGDSISTFKIVSAKDPKQIDRSTTLADGKTIIFAGIYRLEKDKLTVAEPFPFGGKLNPKRPTQFTTKPGDPFVVIVYERVKDESLAKSLQPLAWQSEWKSAFASAKEQDRLVFVDYFATLCKPCQEMDATVFRLPDVKKRLSDFVLLRIDVDRSSVPRAQHVNAFPTYIVYDPGERERFRLIGAMASGMFRGAIDDVRKVAPAFLKASDLFELKKDLDAQFLVGNTYAKLGMCDQARDAYKEARKSAEQREQKGTAQLAEALSAFTFAREGNPSRAIKLLKKLAEKPADRETEALIWLTLGNAFRLSKDPIAAIDAYERAKSAARPDSLTYREAAEAIAHLH